MPESQERKQPYEKYAELDPAVYEAAYLAGIAGQEEFERLIYTKLGTSW